MFKNILIILISFSVISCATVDKTEEKRVIQKYWPKLPEVPRYEYMATIYSSDDFMKKTDAQLLQERMFGKKPPEYVFKRPIDITVRGGMMYFIDSDRPVIFAYDFGRRRMFAFGYRFEGKLVNPVSVAVDKNGLVYVSDRGRNSILVYDSFGLYKATINLLENATQIAGVAIDDEAGYLYVVDRGGIDSQYHQLLQFTLDGQLLKKIGKRGDQSMEFNLPMDVVVDAAGNVYVLDTGNFRVQKIDRDGQFVTSWGKAGNLLGHFGLPRSITVDNENNVYVSDAQFGNIQVFNQEGRLLMHLGRLSQDDEPGAFSLITGISIDDRSYLYVLDQFMKKMEIYKKLDEQEQNKIMGRYKNQADKKTPSR